MNHPDAQRELEQRALQNVRGLVDKIEQTDEFEARKQKRVVIGVLLACVAVAVVLAVTLFAYKRNAQSDVVIDVTKLPAVKAGPQR